MNSIKLEICVYNIESVLSALRGGADRVELCAGRPEGGITPSQALIEYSQQVATEFDKNKSIDIMVMIRPRGGDFLYDDWEFKQMIRDVELCRKIGVRGVVFGILRNDGSVDKDRNRKLLDVAENMQTCFHRAIDMSSDYEKAAEDIVDLGFTRILTSGAMNKAIDGAGKIGAIAQRFGQHTEIMAGSGVNPQNIEEIWQKAKVQAFHFSAGKVQKGGMLYKNPVVSMGGVGSVSEYDVVVSDENQIRKAKEVIKQLQIQ